MIKEIAIHESSPQTGFEQVLAAWRDPETKVVVMRAAETLVQPREFYESQFGSIGTPYPLAEDVTVGGREVQRTGAIWMEVRYDPRFPDAYRHSPNAQPLHTDGSYIPDFPNATLMVCVASAGVGGETIFVDGEDFVGVLREEDAALFEALTARTLPHKRSGDSANERVIDIRADGAWLNWNYYCVDADIDTEGKVLAEKLFGFLQTSPGIQKHIRAVKLNPGDAVTWKDRRVLHGRNAFVATSTSERFLWKCAIDVGEFEN